MDTSRASRFGVYTDVSRRNHVTAYAAWVVEGSLTFKRWCEVLPRERKSSVAEVIASTRAISLIRDGSEVVVYTDIDSLPRMVAGKWLGNSEMTTAVAFLLEELARFSKYEVRIVDRTATKYRWCHKAARQEASRCKKLKQFGL